jgi:hypothetical protein
VSRRPKRDLNALAAAIAGGASVSAWAADQKPPIPKRTAYTWSRLPQVKDAVRKIRNRALDRAAGQLARGAARAARRIIDLARNAESEAVALAAARAVLADLRTSHVLEDQDRRLTEIEAKLKQRQAAQTDGLYAPPPPEPIAEEEK